MNSAAGNVGTVPRLARAEFGSLRPRVLSAMALAPFPIAAIWFGSPWLPLLTALAGAVMAWEWGRLWVRFGWRFLAFACCGSRAAGRTAERHYYGSSPSSGRRISALTRSGG